MYSLKVFLVSNSRIRFSESGRVELIVEERGADVADDLVVEHVSEEDIVILPASECLKKGALVMGNTGKQFDEYNIGAHFFLESYA